jgi:hypothetical protein
MPQFSVPLEQQLALRDKNTIGVFGTFTVSGSARYERYFPTAAGAVDYGSSATSLPIRRAIVQIMNGTTSIASGLTDDNGLYSVSVTAATGTALTVRIQARSTVTSYAVDGVGPNNCNGGSWDIRVVNNATGDANSQANVCLRPQYTLDSSAFTALSSGTHAMPQLTAALSFSGGVYTERAGAPFALLDTAISAIETSCQGRAAIAFPTVYINWSSSNTTAGGNKYDGNIATSFFTTETSSKIANVYILGKTDVDTDELDNHVVAHEFGHYLENKIYRSDSIGGVTVLAIRSIRDSRSAKVSEMLFRAWFIATRFMLTQRELLNRS